MPCMVHTVNWSFKSLYHSTDPIVTALQKLDVLENLVNQLIARPPPPPVRFCQVALQIEGLLPP